MPFDSRSPNIPRGADVQIPCFRTSTRGAPSSDSSIRSVFPCSVLKKSTTFAVYSVRRVARIGGRTPGPDSLTPTEQEVAELVASGLTNREAAQALFLSVSTVEANLRQIYRKLGVRSRAELWRRLPER